MAKAAAAAQQAAKRAEDGAGSEEAVVRVEGLSKLYRRTSAGHHLRTLKSALLDRNLVQGLSEEESIPAVLDVSFSVRRGEAVGLIGSNGSGKSTLLKVAAGILRPTAGTVDIDGRVAALIELGAGFHPEISGRENIYINGAVLGLSKKEIDHRFDDIVEFSGLRDFIEEPVKNYSSGMYVRLGFAVAIHTEPDVLMVDEVLSVGDEAFGQRCLRRIEEFLARGKTLVLVSHSLSLIEEVCDRALWLEKGRLRLAGHPRRVIDAYRESIAEAAGEDHRQAQIARAEESAEDGGDEAPEAEGPVLRWGSGAVTVERLRVLAQADSGAEERYHLRSGEGVRFEIEIEVHLAQEDFVFGISIATPRQTVVWGTNTGLAGFEPGRLETGCHTLAIDCPCLRLGPGEYLVDIAAHALDGTPYDYRRQLVALSVTASERGDGVYFPPHSWSFAAGEEGGIEWRKLPEETRGTQRSS
ncbi:MAG: ABC transporter ATP-binding protein [Acidobacteriota bacterium]